MSFSLNVKREIAGRHGKTARHCMLAELAAILYTAAEIRPGQISFHTENRDFALRIAVLIEKTFRFYPEFKVRRHRKRGYIYYLYITRHTPLVLKACAYGEQWHQLLKGNCCKRAFLRGAFLAAGSVSNPEKTYHLEFITKNEGLAEQIIAVMQEFEIDAKMIRRKNIPVVYLKEGDQIVRLLNVMSAHLALMELENLRIVKDVRNSVNRLVNCEAANLRKTGQAAFRQAMAIDYIEETVGLDFLSDDLKSIAILRKENMAASLKDLGEMLMPPIGRSGVNHRLQRIIEIADNLKEEREEIR
ncbi:DNA-binding protein WhiA [Clostridiales bacterium COT073_COT-073]|nr:DNA-binding protein WhiA [Clostridiales bacterium COT073_COT-073]